MFVNRRCLPSPAVRDFGPQRVMRLNMLVCIASAIYQKRILARKYRLAHHMAGKRNRFRAEAAELGVEVLVEV